MAIPEPGRADDVDALSAVIGDIYDASLDRSVWPKALARATEFVGVHSSSIVTFEARRAGKILLEDRVMDPHYTDLYFSHFIKLDPMLVPKLMMEPGEMLANTEIIPLAEIERTRIFREWARPQGVVDCLNATLERSVDCVACLTMITRVPCDEATKRRAKLLVPHFQRTVAIGRIFDLRTTEVRTFGETLDGLSAGIFLVDADGGLEHANTAGRAMLADGDALHLAGRRLATHDRSADKDLQDTLAQAAAGDRSVGVRGIALSLPAENGPRHVAHVLPLRDGRRRHAAERFRATAALFVQPASRERIEPPVVLARAYGLTIAETRVLVAIVDVGGVPAVADALGLAEATIKVHLKSIYRKTGATRHADLVKLVAGFASPFGDAHGHC